MRTTTALIISTALILGTIGATVAQTSTTPPLATTPPPAPATPAPAPVPATKVTPEEKAKKAMANLDQRKAACMQRAGTDDAKKAECEKMYVAAKAKIMQAEKKAMDKIGTKK